MGCNITKHGEIYHKGKLVKGWIQGGYRMVCMNYKKFYVHRLVAEKYISNPNGLDCINHINGDKLDNRIENLEWISRRDNCEHARLNGLSEDKSKGIKNITFQEFCDIIKLKTKGYSYRKIGEIMQLNHRRINSIYNGERYKDYHTKLKEVNLV